MVVGPTRQLFKNKHLAHKFASGARSVKVRKELSAQHYAEEVEKIKKRHRTANYATNFGERKWWSPRQHEAEQQGVSITEYNKHMKEMKSHSVDMLPYKSWHPSSYNPKARGKAKGLKHLRPKDIIFNWKLNAGDEVEILSGDDYKKRGKILMCVRDRNCVVVEGIRERIKNIPNCSQYPEGGCFLQPGLVPVSEVALLDPVTKEPTEVYLKIIDGKEERVSRTSGFVIEKQRLYLPDPEQEEAERLGKSDGLKDTTELNAHVPTYQPSRQTFDEAVWATIPQNNRYHKFRSFWKGPKLPPRPKRKTGVFNSRFPHHGEVPPSSRDEYKPRYLREGGIQGLSNILPEPIQKKGVKYYQNL